MFKKLLEKLRTNKNNTSTTKSVKSRKKLKTAQNKKESDQFYKDMERGFLDEDF